MPESALAVTRIAGALGAELRGLDLKTIDADGARRVERLLWEHQVLIFPDQHPSIPQHVAFGEHFGELEGHPHLTNPDLDHDKVFELAASHGGIADEWHTDLTFRSEPALYSILHMKKCPPVGGDTMWANLYQAFDELSPPLRDLCEGLSALHNAEPHGKPEVMTVHPVVRVHPETGRKVLYVNEHFTRRILELSAAESDLLLGHLTRWLTSPRFTMRYRWTEGTLAMWDNRCTQHFVLNDFTGERIIQRVTVMGDKPMGSSPRWEPHLQTNSTGISVIARHDALLREYLRGRERSAGD